MVDPWRTTVAVTSAARVSLNDRVTLSWTPSPFGENVLRETEPSARVRSRVTLRLALVVLPAPSRSSSSRTASPSGAGLSPEVDETRPSHATRWVAAVTLVQPVTRRSTASSAPITETRAVPDSPGTKASLVASACPSPFGLKGSGATEALSMRGGTVSRRRVAVAGRATPAALVASACSVYTPSGSAAPSSSWPAHVVSTSVPSPLRWRTSRPASSRIATVQEALWETVNPMVVRSRTPSPFGLMEGSATTNP